MADELKVTLGVEIDPAGMANVKSELDSLKNSKDNKIEIEFKSQSMAGFSKNLASLRKDIDALNNKQINIDVNTTALNNLQNLIGNINQQLSNLGQNIANAGNNAGSSGSGNGSGRNSNLWINGNIPVGPAQLGDVRRYQQELDRMADSYARIFGGSGGTLDSRSFKYDIVNDSATAVLKFNDAIGDTHNLMVKLNNVSKGETNWNVVSQSFSQNLGRQTAEIDRSLDKLSEYQIKLDKLKVSASSGSKPLSEGFADTFNREAQVFQNGLRAYSSLVSGPDGTALDASQIRDLNEAYNELVNTLKVQRDLQWTGSKLNATDISSQIKEYSAKINELKNDLSNKGIGDVFKTQINDLSNQLNTQVQNGTMGITEWKSKLQELKASIQEFQSSNNGKAQMLAFDIDTNQVKQIEDLLMTIRSIPENLQGSGVEELKKNITDLLFSYSNLSAELKGSNLKDDDFGRQKLADLRKELTDLDNQLKQASNATQVFQDGWANDQKIQSFLNKSEDLKTRFEQLKQRYEEFVEANPSKANSGIERQLDSLSDKMNNLDPKNFDRIREGVNGVGREINNVVSGGKSLAQILQGNFGGVGQYLSRFVTATFAITKGIQTIKSMVNEVKSLDTSLMELQKVTNLSGDSLAQFTDKAYDVGKGLGRTGKDVVDAVTTFSRAGYNLDESTDLAKSALVMSNVGVDIPNMESAASDMISIMKAFDVQAEDSMSVIDKLYNVANKEPLDFGNITTMLVTAGGTLAQTNTTLEQTMGLLTGGYATLRDNSVANGLIQISQRLRGVKEDGTSMEADFIPKLKKAFDDAGVSIEDDNGELRSTFDILSDLAGKWDELSTKQKQFLGEKAAGNRQVKVLNAIMANWDTVTETIENAENATGAATEGNEKYLDSIEGRITSFKSAFQNLSRELISSDFVKNTISFGSSVVGGLTDIISKTGQLVPILTTVTGLVMSLKGAKIGEGLKAIFSGLTGGSAIASIGMFTALLGGLAAYSSVANKYSQSLNKLKSSQEAYTEGQSKISSLNGELSVTQNKIDSLKSMGSLTFVEQSELSNLEQTNKKLEEQLKIEENLQKVRKGSVDSAFNQAVDAFKRKDETVAVTAGQVISDLFNISSNALLNNKYTDPITGELYNAPGGFTSNSQLDNFNADLQTFQKIAQNREKVLSQISKIAAGETNATNEELQDLQLQYDKLNTMATEYYESATNIYNDLVASTEGVERNAATESSYQFLDQVANALYSYGEAYGGLSSGSWREGSFNTILDSNTYANTVKELKSLAEQGELTLESFSNTQGIKQFVDAINMIGVSSEDAIEYINSLYKVEKEVAKTIEEETIKSLEDLTKENYLTSDAYKELSSAMAEQQKAGNISIDTYKKLIDANGEYNKLLEVSAEGYKLNNKAVEEYIETKARQQKIEAMLTIDEQVEQLEKLREEYDKLVAVGDKDGAFKNLGEQEAIQSEISALQAYISELDNARSALTRFKEAKSSANEDANYQATQDIYDVLKSGNRTGKKNTDEFTEAMNYVLGDNWEQNLDKYGGSVEAAQKFAEKQAKLYSDMSDAKEEVDKANKEKKAANELFKNMANAGFGTYDKSTGSFSFNNENQSLDEVGSALGLSAEYVRDILKMANTYAKAGEGFSFSFLMTDEERAAYEERKAQIKEVEDEKAKVAEDIKKTQAEIDSAEAGSDTTALETKLKQLENSSKGLDKSLDTLKSGATSEEAVKYMSPAEMIQQYQEMTKQLTDMQATGVNIPITLTGQYQEIIDTLPGKITELQQPVPIDIQADDKGTVDEVKGKIDALNTEEHMANVSAQVDGSVDEVGKKLDEVAKDRTATIKVQYEDKNGELHDDPYGVGLAQSQFTEEGVIDSKTLTPEQQLQLDMLNPDQIVDVLRQGGSVQIDVKPTEDSGQQFVEGVQEEIDSSNANAVIEPKVDNHALTQEMAEGYNTAMDTISDEPIEINVDTSKMPEVIDEAIPENETINVNANVNADSTANQKIENTEVTQKAKLDTSAAEGQANKLNSKIQSSATKPVDANISSAMSQISRLDAAASRTVTKTINVQTTGSANATGTKKATEGISLVDEKGPELIEHTKKGTYELGTDQGPRLTNLEAGDVVHTAEETRKIMSRIAKVGGFFRNGLNKAKAFFGNAYATGVSGGISGLIASVTSSGKKKTSGSSSSSNSSSSSSSKKWKKWLEKLFDWAEIRLKRLQTVTNAWLLSASEAVGYMAKNKELTNALSSVQDQIEATTAAYDLYLQQAELIAQKSKLADDIVQKIQDGSIEIGEYDKKTQEKIKAYSTWCRFFTPPWAVMLIENSI